MKYQNDSSEDIDAERSCEDDVSRMNTEDSLLSSKASSVNINKSGNVTCCGQEDVHWKCCNPRSKIVIGALLAIWGVATIIWTPYDLTMSERIRMRPGLPAYEWWKSPPDEVILKVYVFNITNADRFLSGEDAKLNFEEVGPIVYLEKLTHTNVTFNDNGTLTYVATRRAIYLPEENTIDLNKTITVANYPLLGMASQFWDSTFFEKIAFNMVVSSSNSNATVEMTIYNYLWNYTDPIIELGQDVAPKMVPVDNLGVLTRIYENFTDTVTVYVGAENGNEKFFLIDKYDGSEYLPNHRDDCEDKVSNSSEGVTYPAFLTRDSVIRYWRKSICFVAPLHYQYDKEMYGVKTYKYVLGNDSYDRTEPADEDCYKSEPTLPNGLKDASKCYFDFPIATSFPHFLFGDPKLKDYVDGMQPDEAKHESYTFVEPNTGIPTTSQARSQSNLVVRKLEGFSDEIEKFSELVLPMFWADYHQVGLPWYIVGLLYFLVKVLPIFQRICTAFLLILGVLLIILGSKQHAESRRSYLTNNKMMQYEQQVFLKV